MQQVSMLVINPHPTGLTFSCLNYKHLSMLKQDWLRQQLLDYFAPAVPEVSNDMLKVNVTFMAPVHVGAQMRRLEMLIFKLRCNVDPLLSFEPAFRY